MDMILGLILHRLEAASETAAFSEMMRHAFPELPQDDDFTARSRQMAVYIVGGESKFCQCPRIHSVHD
jgi:hypothetical protein